MDRLEIRQGGDVRTVAFEGPLLLSEAIRRAGFFPPMPCGGHHTCGKCLVTVRGAFSPPAPEESGLAGTGRRLACCTLALGDGQVTLPPPDRAEVLTAPPEAPRRGGGPLGLTADIGTTTIAACLYDLAAGQRLAAAGGLNRQTAWGSDVIARIGAAGREGVAPLQTSVTGQLLELFQDCLSQVGGTWEEVARVAVTGNTVMLHLLTGLDPAGMAAAPFAPQSLFGQRRNAVVLFPPLSGAELLLPRCMSAFVGADITCAALAAGLSQDGDTALLVDVGTNGEMVLRARGRLFCCSTAAGPAFEGAGLSQGMTAAPGAVSAVRWADGELCCRTVGGAPPLGLCGTGAISALNAMLAGGILDETGRIQAEGPAGLVTDGPGGRRFALGTSGVSLTQEDVRQLQLAKAAIAAGVDCLLHEAGLAPDQVDRLILCGGFGSQIDPAEAAGIGLFPAALLPRVSAAGNAAEAGAAQLLLSPGHMDEADRLARSAVELPLSSSAWFMDRYVENMFFAG